MSKGEKNHLAKERSLSKHVTNDKNVLQGTMSRIKKELAELRDYLCKH